MAKGGPVSWTEGSRLVAEFGNEDHLAARITTEREARGWSQSQLSREMAGIGRPIPQTAISKIENPQRGGRRAISVDEAVGFSKLFGVPLGELLMPASTLKHLKIVRDIADGPAALIAKDEAQLVYDDLAERLAALIRIDGQWQATLEDELHRAVAAQESAPDSQMAQARMQFLYEVVINRGQKKGAHR